MFVTFVLLGFGHPNHRKTYFLTHVPLGLFSHADSCGFIYLGVKIYVSGISSAQKQWGTLGTTFSSQSLIECFFYWSFQKKKNLNENVKHVPGVYYSDK